MAFSVIIVLYVTIGLMSAAGSVAISQRLFSPKAERIFFGIFLVPIAGFYLAFAAYFDARDAWRLEAAAVTAFAILGVLGTRASVVLVLGYALHGVWDLLHELQAHAGLAAFGASRATEIPLAYGAFCATYDWCMAAYFYTRRSADSASPSTPRDAPSNTTSFTRN